MSSKVQVCILYIYIYGVSLSQSTGNLQLKKLPNCYRQLGKKVILYQTLPRRLYIYQFPSVVEGLLRVGVSQHLSIACRVWRLAAGPSVWRSPCRHHDSGLAARRPRMRQDRRSSLETLPGYERHSLGMPVHMVECTVHLLGKH